MILPPQKLSNAAKLKRDASTGKNNIEETIDYYISSCNWNKQTEEILALYRAVEGHLDPQEYKNIQNPFAKSEDAEKTVMAGARLQNYNILRGIANLLMGEFGRRSHEYTVHQFNPTDEISYKQGLDALIKGYYSQQVANQLLKLGADFGQQVVELPPLEQYVEGFKQKFDDARVISGQDAIDYIRFNCHLDDKYLDLYWDWIITGSFYTYKTVNHDDVYFETVPAHEIFTFEEKHSRFVEDWSCVVRRQILPAFKVLDFFKGRVEEEFVDKLENSLREGFDMQFSSVTMTGRNGALVLPTMYMKGGAFNSFTNGTGVELFHVQYKTFREYQILTYSDPISGEELEMEVGDDYTLNKAQGDISLKEEYENIIYEGYKCLDTYLDCGEVKCNRADLNQTGLQKLSYNGRRERSSTGEIQSIIKEGLPFQRIVNILHFQFEKLINKNKDKMVVMPYGLVPRKKGIDTKSFMHHSDATSIMWIDETAPNASFAAQMIKVLDMSLGPYIKDLIGTIQFVKQEYWDSIGMNAQRYADVGANAGKAVTEQAIVRSAIITYELTRQFDECINRDYQGFLDLSKMAWINGKKGMYIRSDASHAFLKLNADDAVYHSESSYGVFIKDASVNSEAIQAIRGQGMNLVQNGAGASTLAKLWSTNSVDKLSRILEKMEENKQQYDAMVAEQQQAGNLALQESKNENDLANREIEMYKSDNLLEGVKYAADAKTESNKHQAERPANDVERALADHKIRNDNEQTAIDAQAKKDKAKADLIKANKPTGSKKQ